MQKKFRNASGDISKLLVFLLRNSRTILNLLRIPRTMNLFTIKISNLLQYSRSKIKQNILSTGENEVN